MRSRKITGSLVKAVNECILMNPHICSRTFNLISAAATGGTRGILYVISLSDLVSHLFPFLILIIAFQAFRSSFLLFFFSADEQKVGSLIN